MLAYTAQNARPAGRAGSPKALTLIVAGHAVLIVAVMTAKMEIIPVAPKEPPIIVTVPPEAKPPEPEVRPQPEPRDPQLPFIAEVKPIVPVELPTATIPVVEGPVIRELPPIGGSGGGVTAVDPPKHVPVKIAAVSRTSDSALRPPYPNDKLRLEQEATLKLRLTIDPHGRVTAVDPVGAADPSFLEAARRHIIRAWRYKPATEDGVAVSSTMIINLSFRLEHA